MSRDMQIRGGVQVLGTQSATGYIPRPRGSGRGIYDASQDTDEEIPVGDHDLQRAELPGCVPQSRRRDQVQEQEHHHQVRVPPALTPA